MFDVVKIRKDFPVLERKINGYSLVYLDSGATSQKPESVIRAMDKYYRETNANIHRGVYEMSAESTRLVDEAREKVARFVCGRNEEIVFTRNATESINLVTYAWGEENVQPGDAVVITKLEHHSNIVPWQELCRRKQAELRVVEIDKEGEPVYNKKPEIVSEDNLRVISGGWFDLLDEKVKLVAFAGQANVLGTIVPVEKVVRMIREKAAEAKILIDGAQMVPHCGVNVEKMGADFLAFSGHKMLGPTGVGVLWAKKELLQKMRPFLFGGDMIGEVKLAGTTWADLPAKFEAGTPDIAGVIGLGAAVDYLNVVGMDDVCKHEKTLVAYALEKMKVLEDQGLLTIYGLKSGERGGAIAFNVNGVHAHDTAQILDSYGVAVRSGQHCAAPLVESFGVTAMVRASFYLYNTEEEIDYLVDALKKVPKVFS